MIDENNALYVFPEIIVCVLDADYYIEMQLRLSHSLARNSFYDV